MGREVTIPAAKYGTYTHIRQLLTLMDSLSSAAAGPELENRPPLPVAMATRGNMA